MRYAIYFTPPADDLLTRLAIRWLGRDAFTGERYPAVSVGSLSASEQAFYTANARRYGFHGTLKAPFRLSEDATEQDLVAAATEFGQTQEPVFLPEIHIKRLDGFFALTPASPSEDLNRLARDIVVDFDRFRAPLTQTEIERRDPHKLTIREQCYLHQWGYPYIFDGFRFHMTLTGQIMDADAQKIEASLNEWFADIIATPLTIGSLTLFVEPEPGAPFEARETFPMKVGKQRKTA